MIYADIDIPTMVLYNHRRVDFFSNNKKVTWSHGHQDRPIFVCTFRFETKISIYQWQRERMWPPFTKSAFDRSRMADWMNATIKPTLGLDR